jgi:serine/threonine-protein kinase
MANDDHCGSDPAREGSDSPDRLRALFETLIEIPDAQRAAWLDAHVRDAGERSVLLRWLAFDSGTGFLDTPAVARAADLAADEVRSESLIGRQVGSFVLSRAIGSGGMAAVFLGRRVGSDFDQDVAIKVLRRGLYSDLEQRLFQRERRVLAALDHPNIARLIDGGISAAGIPYLVMEFVDGVPITQYADAHAHDVAQRLRLFLAVCQAVEAAHRNLIVHRDIKPSNILVSDAGDVKLLDFGIAKLIEDDASAATATVGVFTPHYAAPEQIEGGAITTATDVYGLGVLLHELLLGLLPSGNPTRRPSSRAGETAHRQADATSLLAPARLRKLLRGDLDNIVLKALAEEPSRRYASAGSLAEDIVRYLERRPVAAHPPSLSYRMGKFMQRHRAGVAVAAAVVVAILAALALALWQADIARREARRANTVRNFMEDMFAPIDSGVIDSKQMSVHDLLANATRKLEKNSELGAAERIDLQLMFSRLHEKVGEPGQAQALATQAAELARASLSPRDPLALDAEISHAYALAESNKPEQAEPLLKSIEARIGDRQLIGGLPLVRLLDGLADVADRHGEHDIALAYERRALAERMAKFGADTVQTATGYNNVAISMDLSGHHDEAIDAFRHAHAIQLARAGPDSIDTAIARGNLAHAELLAGRLKAAYADFLAVEPVFDAAPNNKRNRNAYYWQDRCQLAIARDAQTAEPACLRSLQATRELLAADVGRSSRALRLDGLWKIELGRFDDARNALQQASALLGVNGQAPWLGYIDYGLAVLDQAEGQSAQALSGLSRALEHIGHDYPPYTRLNALSLRALICAAERNAVGAFCPADAQTLAATELDAQSDRWNPLLLPAHVALARIELTSARAAAAVTRLRNVIDRAQPDVEPAQMHLVEARLWLAAAEAQAGDCGRSLADAATAGALIDQNGLRDHPLLAAAQAQLQGERACKRG